MIERIYIPTAKRENNQITYNNLPDELKKRVIMVLRPDDRPLYNYDCEYLVVDNDIGIAKTNSTHEVELLESFVRSELNQTADRKMAVINPLKLIKLLWKRRREI